MDRYMGWIRLVAIHNPWVHATEAYEGAIDILPCLFWLKVNNASRLRTLECLLMLTCDVASWFVHHGNATHAVELLEQGCAVFWANKVHIKSTFNNLPAVRPWNCVGSSARESQSSCSYPEFV
jgi:hypothetical protein